MAYTNDRRNHTTFTRRLLRPAVGALTALAMLVAAAPSYAQDAPWGGKPAAKKKKPTVKKQAVKKQAVSRHVVKKQVVGKPLVKSRPSNKRIGEVVAKKPRAVPPVASAPLAQPPNASTPTNGSPSLHETLVLDHFHSLLSPHGQWQRDNKHGLVWVPAASEVGKGFVPYRSNGRWALTQNRKWAWVSNYKWGAVPFHYGRWVPHNNAWAWVPGTKHAPAWVTWRVAEGKPFVGWAPTPPATASHKAPPAAQFTYVPSRYVFSPRLSDFVIGDHALVQQLYHQSHPLQRPAKSLAQGLAPHQLALRDLVLQQRLLTPTSPTLAQANVPSHAAPRVLLRDDDPTIAPNVTARLIGTTQRQSAQPQRALQAHEPSTGIDAKVTAAVQRAKAAQAAADTAKARADRALARADRARARATTLVAQARRKASAAARLKARARAAIANRDAARAEAKAAQAAAAARAAAERAAEQRRRFATPPATERPLTRRLSRAQVRRLRRARVRVLRRDRARRQRFRRRHARDKWRQQDDYRCGWTHQRPRQWRCGPTSR